MKRIAIAALAALAACGGTPKPTEAQKRTLWTAPVAGLVRADTTNLLCWRDETLHALSAARGTPSWSVPLGASRPEGTTGDAVFSRIGENKTTVVAFSASSGSELWRFNAKDAVAVHVAGGQLFLSERVGVHFKLHLVDVTTGSSTWFSEAHAIALQLTMDEQRVYVADHEGNVAAHALDSGRPVWVAKLGKQSFDPIISVAGRVLVNADAPSRKLIAYDAETGQEAWRWTRGSGIVPVWQRSGDQVYYKVGPTVMAINAKTGELLWDSPCQEQPIATDTTLYTGTIDGLRAIDAKSGLVRWEQTGMRRAVYADGEIVAGANDRIVAMLDAATGRELWRFEAPSEIRAARRAGPLLFVEAYDQPEGKVGGAPRPPVRHAVHVVRISE